MTPSRLAAAIGVVLTWGGILVAYDSYEWTGGQGWPVSFCIVTLIFLFYLAVVRAGPGQTRPEPLTERAHVSGAG